jgi:uncharacterized protein YndB with AHSA1/START domain
MTDFRLHTRWELAAPRARVWDALRRPLDWPRWWPYVKSVDELDAGDANGIAARHRVLWTSRLPYSVQLVTRVVEVRAPELIRVQAEGDVRGEGVWQLDGTATGTRVDYTWCVDLDKRWMRALAPLLRKVFAWNHHAVMDAGGAGLAAHLR